MAPSCSSDSRLFFLFRVDSQYFHAIAKSPREISILRLPIYITRNRSSINALSTLNSGDKNVFSKNNFLLKFPFNEGNSCNKVYKTSMNWGKNAFNLT